MESIVVKVGMGSCGIAAGAQKIYHRLEEMVREHPHQLRLDKTNCIGMCYCEPLVEVEMDGVRVIYGEVSEEKIVKIIHTHLEQHRFLEEEVYYAPHFEARENRFLNEQERWALRNCGVINPERIEDYEARGGYQSIARVVYGKPEEVIDMITKSGLQGRGGGGFLTGAKWQLAKRQTAFPKYIICNADEGDPGAFMDRSILEGDPHGVIEGMLIAGFAMGASYGIIYCRAEYPLAIKRLKIAIAQAQQKNYLGENLFGVSDFHFNLTVKEGAGAFVCGEETALIASIEGGRGMPFKRPPFPAERGLWGQPTNINIVETYISVPAIIMRGAEQYAALGTQKAKGTKVFAVTGKIAKSGLVEVPMGSTLHKVVFDICGGVTDGGKMKAVQLGGPSGGCIPAHLIDTEIDYDSIIQTGAIMGSGGMVVMDNTTCMVDVAKFFLTFTQNESCGKCTFCRIGTLRMLEILENITKGAGKIEDLEALEELANEIKANSLCGLGQSAPNPVLSTLRYFREEYQDHIVEKRCPALQCTALVRFRVDKAKCIGCGRCKKNCPSGCINGSEKNVHTIRQEECVRCGNCLRECPVNAILKY